MSTSGKDYRTTRIETSLGTLIVVTHSGGVRAGQTFSEGKHNWYAQCADWYGAGIPPRTSRVPEKGGLSSLDELEQAIVREVTGQMQTDYWSDR